MRRWMTLLRMAILFATSRPDTGPPAVALSQSGEYLKNPVGMAALF